MNENIYLIAILVSSLAGSIILTATIIPRLKKIARQPIYEDGPSWHMSKSGTPTMGGLGFIIPISVIALVGCLIKGSAEWLSATFSIAFALCNSFIGIADDITKLKRAANGGLTPKQKLLLQSFFAVLFLIGRRLLFGDGTDIYFGKLVLDLGIIYYPFALIFILGIVNCANLTDGVDGLASSVAFIIFNYLAFATIGVNNGVTIMSISVLGGILGFMIFNLHPAKIFMGDTGSLFLGALVASFAFSTKALPSILLAGGVYVIEGISVIAQVVYYKKTKKRLFKMAPLHHHLEKCGRDEGTICVMAILATCIFSLISYMILPW